MAKKKKHKWLRNKGYLHITPQINVDWENRGKILSKLRDTTYIEKHDFFPLIHSSIKERKYKYIPGTTKRAHSYEDSKGEVIMMAKDRPLHYATHIDSLIFGYYGELLSYEYEKLLWEKHPQLNECIIAYRQVKIEDKDKNKSTAHFANDVFTEIKKRAAPSCAVLMYDIDKFFPSIDHELLKQDWTDLLGGALPMHHEKVLKATTKFSYILLDDLRTGTTSNGKKSNFDEKKLHEIRKLGQSTFFSSVKEFREKIKNKELKVYTSPFWNKKRHVPTGIPQGLPISPVLANLYLLTFDLKMYQKIVVELGGFYRRYSDDILIACDPQHVEIVDQIVRSGLEERLVEISKKKTEQFLFRHVWFSKDKKRLTSIKVWTRDNVDPEVNKVNEKYEKYRRYECCQIGMPLAYLGFEFFGYQTLIKSTNLSKFYRRMVLAVKRKANRARKMHETDPNRPLAIYRNQLEKLFLDKDLSRSKIISKFKSFKLLDNGEYKLKSEPKERAFKSNYLSYVKRVGEIIDNDEANKIEKQVRKHKEIFSQAVDKHLNKENT
jgi:hypothetical protein